jgi:plastocyanin
MQRRDFMAFAGLSLAAAFAGVGRVRSAGLPTIRMYSDRSGARVGFSPIGLFVEPGETVRWLNESGVHTVTAYHPNNGSRPLRIPEQAEPWDSGYLVNAGDMFERRFDVPGVYDYCCIPHEGGGMVGRLVVGHVSGPGAMAFGTFATQNPGQSWKEIPDAARANFPDPHRIICDGAVRGHTSHR